MEKEDLIKKWLDNDLNPQELKAFEALEDYESLLKIARFSKEYTAPQFNKKKVLDTVLISPKSKKHTITSLKKQLLKVAALIAICFSTYYYTTTLDSNFSTTLAQRTSIALPDNSTADLNAGTNLSFNTSKWTENRAVVLDGEAFFKVAKGSTFSVLTADGTVTVLGTQFNVKQRNNYFEVTCFEGLVEVSYHKTKTILKPGESFISIYKRTVKNTEIISSTPDWLNQFSAFKSIPLREVLDELERQYNVLVDASNIDTAKEFTGRFPHNNIDTALQSILEPLHLKYKIKERNIILERE